MLALPAGRSRWLLLTIALITFAGLFAARVHSYLLFHSLAEMFTIAISCAVFILAWNTRRQLPGGYLLLVGAALLFSSALNVAHTLSYKGMNVFAGYDANLPTQLWLARRYLEVGAFLVAPLFLRRRIASGPMLAALGLLTALALVTTFGRTFPVAYIEGRGLTSFKVASEYVLAAAFLVAGFWLWRRRSELDPLAAYPLVAAMVVSAAAELMFTLYLGVYDLANLLGHFLTIVASYLVYRAIVSTGLVRPYQLLTGANEALRAEVRERERAELALREAAAVLDNQRQALERQALRLQSLHEIDQAILAAHSVNEIAQTAAAHIRQLIGCQRVAVYLLGESDESAHNIAADEEVASPIGRGASVPYEFFARVNPRWPQPGRPTDLTQISGDCWVCRTLLAAGIRYNLTLPLFAGQVLIGALTLGASEVHRLDGDAEKAAAQVADSLSVALDHARLYEEVCESRAQLESLSRRMVEVQEQERRDVAIELHDDSGQILASLALGLGILQRRYSGSTEALTHIETLKQMAQEAIAGIHRVGADLRPVALDKLGLSAALRQYVEWFGREHNLPVECAIYGLDRECLTRSKETGIYRIVQEALANVAQHAQATRIAVLVSRVDGIVKTIIEDDGVGFDLETVPAENQLGLVSMRQRAAMLGGTFEIESSPGRGATVYVVVPVGPPECDN